MNLKTALFIALFLGAISLSHQATADNEQVNVESNDPNLLEQARATERRAVAELKAQAQNAKEQFKAAFNKLKATRASSEQQESSSDSSDSDSIIQKAISEAETAADQIKQGEWKGVSELKAQAQRAKDAYKTAKASLKSRFSKKSSDSSESSESSDDVRDATEGVVDRAARAAEWKIIAELKEQYNNAKRAAKTAYKRLRNKEDSSSSSSSDDGAIKEAVKDKVEERVTEAVHETVQEGKEGLLEQARNAQKAAYQELLGGVQNAKDAFWNAYKELKNKIRTEKGQQEQQAEESSSSSSSSSSDSSDSSDDSILKKARRYAEILRNRVGQAKDEALNKADELRNREHVDNDL